MELGRRLWRNGLKDDLLGRAAQLSYFVLLALFPALIVLTAAMGLFSVQNYTPELMSYLRNVLPHDALSMVEEVLVEVAEGSGANIFRLVGLVPYGPRPAAWSPSSKP